MHFDYEASPVFPVEEGLPETEVNDYQIKRGNGLVQTISKMVTTLDEIKDSELPPDGEIERTVDRLERFLISKEISLSLHLFVSALALASFLSIYHRAWFSLLIGRALFIFTLSIAGINVLRSILHMRFIFVPGLLSFLSHFSVLLLSVYAFFAIRRYLEEEEVSFTNLYIASFNAEDSNTGKIALPFEKKSAREKKGFFRTLAGLLIAPFRYIFKNKIIIHFAVIISIGIVLGNLVYIPLFSLQKHYVREFGYLIGVSLVILSVFYIRNYYYIGKDEGKTIGQNLSISYSFLIYRFLRNVLLIAFTTLGVILFVIALLLILNYNISLLIDNNVIEKTISL
jgi:hypothetical protein